MMADQLSMFFEMQGAMVGLIFLASNYYIWLSMKRVEGVERVRMSLLTVIVMVALPFIMTYTWTLFPAPDPSRWRCSFPDLIPHRLWTLCAADGVVPHRD